MLSKNFYIQLILRVFGITIIALIFAFSTVAFNLFFMIPSALLLGFQITWLIRYLNRNNRRMAYFFESIKNEDYTLQFPENESLESLNELHKGLNKVNHLIRETQIRNKAQEKYYQEILKEATIGILTFNQKGHILFSNPTAKKLLNHEHLSHIKQIEMIHAELYSTIKDIQPFEKKLFEFSNERESRQLVIKCNEIILNNESLLLVVIQDIKNELDEKETDSWIKLIRVLTHEIMNTIAPITSISESLLKHYRKENILNENETAMVTKGLQVIQEQSQNLTAFVQSYRRLLNVSKPDKEIINISNLFEKIKALMQEEFLKASIELHIDLSTFEVEIFADEKQITQVLLNLLKNAMQALKNRSSAKVYLEGGVHTTGEKYIAVRDNGPGISKEELDQVFIPFFTTKSNGTGIGLSLSKQILNMHGGSLSVRSQPNVETVFMMKF